MLVDQLIDLSQGELIFGVKESSFNLVSKASNPLDGSIVFVNSLKFLNKYLETEDKPHSHCIVIDHQLLESEVEKVKNLKNRIQCLISTQNTDQAICYISKFFYDQYYSKFEFNKSSNHNKYESSYISENVFIGPSVKIGNNSKIHAGVVLMGDIEIGENSEIFPNVTVYPNVRIGENCRIHSQSVIGSDGFGYKFINGKHLKIWHYGGVRIGNDVEIGASTCIDGGTFSPTKIGDGCIIDNQVQIAHNCELGKYVVLCGKAGLAGSASLEDYCVLGGGAGIGPDCHLGKGCKVGGGGLVNRSWPAGSTISGYPAVELRQWKRSVIKLQRLASE